MQIATNSHPNVTALFTGSTILQNVGLSPLELAAIGLLSRLQESINKTHHTSLATKIFKVIELIILVGLILGIVGGINASDNYVKNHVYQASSLSKAGTALFIVSFVGILIGCAFTSFSVSHAEQGEKRLLLAVAISLPFILVRLIYSIMITFTHNKNFNGLTPNVTILLCVALIEEFIVVLVYEGFGLTLHQVQKEQHVEGNFAGHQPVPSTSSSQAQYRPAQPKENVVLGIAKKTIIGRIVMSLIPSKKEEDVQLHQQDYVQK
jgi:hypothetical protein